MKKHLREGLRRLGDSYSIKNIDFEDCLYKDLGNGIDFEISYGDGSYCIFVWRYKSYLQVIKIVPDIPLSELKGTLDELENEFMDFE